MIQEVFGRSLVIPYQTCSRLQDPVSEAQKTVFCFNHPSGENKSVDNSTTASTSPRDPLAFEDRKSSFSAINQFSEVSTPVIISARREFEVISLFPQQYKNLDIRETHEKRVIHSRIRNFKHSRELMIKQEKE